MSIDIGSFFRHALHVKPATLKGAPFVHPGQEQAAANSMNAVTGPLAEAALAAFPAIAENALKVQPDQLKGLPGIADHDMAAAVINGIVAEKLSTP